MSENAMRGSRRSPQRTARRRLTAFRVVVLGLVGGDEPVEDAVRRVAGV